MSLQPVQLPEPLLLVPPLLVLRTRNGFFGAKRFGPGEFDRCRPCGRFRAPPDPPPPPPVRYLRQQVHEGWTWRRGRPDRGGPLRVPVSVRLA
jgi:hypothetical protein